MYVQKNAFHILRHADYFFIFQTEEAVSCLFASQCFRLEQYILHPSSLLRVRRFFAEFQIYLLGLGCDT